MGILWVLERAFYEVRCHCYKARSLIASDETGLSDPYLSITAGNETQTTPVRLSLLVVDSTECRRLDSERVSVSSMECHLSLPRSNSRRESTDSRRSDRHRRGRVLRLRSGSFLHCSSRTKKSSSSLFLLQSGEESDLIGRFSSTARLAHSTFRWYEFQFDGKRAGELLAAFELIELDGTNRELEEIPVTSESYPSESYVTTLMKNRIYRIPSTIMPDLLSYEIEVIFWGLRECRSINFQAIEQAEVSIECAGARLTKTIRDVQKNPNFPLTNDKVRLLVVRRFSRGPGVDRRSRIFLGTTTSGRTSVSSACKIVSSGGKKWWVISWSPTCRNTWRNLRCLSLLRTRCSPMAGTNCRRKSPTIFSEFVDRSSTPTKVTLLSLLRPRRSRRLFAAVATDKARPLETESQLTTSNADLQDQVFGAKDVASPLTLGEKSQRIQMEKGATWWSKYYASKAKLVRRTSSSPCTTRSSSSRNSRRNRRSTSTRAARSTANPSKMNRVRLNPSSSLIILSLSRSSRQASLDILDESEESLSTRGQSSSRTETVRPAGPREPRREEERQISGGRKSRDHRNRSVERIDTPANIRRKTTTTFFASLHRCRRSSRRSWRMSTTTMVSTIVWRHSLCKPSSGCETNLQLVVVV